VSQIGHAWRVRERKGGRREENEKAKEGGRERKGGRKEENEKAKEGGRGKEKG
jgi:hypothetical protein